ncbi:MAG: lipopolysaccharide kinase InaA family protein [Planctomycetota bacterium]
MTNPAPTDDVRPAIRAAAVPSIAVLAVDDRTRVERIDRGDHRLLRKCYSFAGLLSLRTFLRRSRAEREFCNLRLLSAADVPCVQAVRWTEQRSRGCVKVCEVVTEFADGSVDLRSALRNTSGRTERRRLSRELGGLMAAVHRADYRSSTASLRNVLRCRDGSLVLCDQPYAARLWGPVASWARGLDLFDTFFSPGRCADWSNSERWLGLQSYHGGDVDAARTTWRRMSRRPRYWFRLARQLSRLAVFHRPSSHRPSRRPKNQPHP